PAGQNRMKLTIISPIHAGFPMSSRRAAIVMAEAPHVNVYYIHILSRFGPVKSRPEGSVRSRRFLGFDDAEPAQIDEDARFAQLLGRHRQFAPAGIAAREQ